MCGWLAGSRSVMWCCHWPCGLVWCMGVWLVGWLCAWVCGWLPLWLSGKPRRFLPANSSQFSAHFRPQNRRKKSAGFSGGFQADLAKPKNAKPKNPKPAPNMQNPDHQNPKPTPNQQNPRQIEIFLTPPPKKFGQKRPNPSKRSKNYPNHLKIAPVLLRPRLAEKISEGGRGGLNRTCPVKENFRPATKAQQKLHFKAVFHAVY